MGYRSDLKTSSREHQTSKVLKEKIVSPQANKNLKSLDCSNVDKPFGQPYVSRHELRQCAGERPVVQLNSSVNQRKEWFKNKTIKDDELVKHMRNLPAYLQRVEKGENLQRNALNFGVLDWGRLENWKSNEKRIPPKFKMKTSSSSSNPSIAESGSAILSRTALSKTLTPQRKQPASNGCPLDSSYEERLSQGVPWSRGKVIQLQDLEKEQHPRLKDLYSSSNDSEIKLDGSTRKHASEMNTVEKKTSMSDRRKPRWPHSSNDTMSAQDGATKMKLEGDINLAHEQCPSGHQSIVLLLPGESPRMSYDGTEANERRLSDCFFPEGLHSVDPFSEVPHSCPLPLGIATYNESECPNEIPTLSFKGRYLEEKKSVMEDSTTSENSKSFDQDISERPCGKGRHPSPNRRFSFSLGKMTRSFSFKESSAVPQSRYTYSTTVKPGPVKAEASTGLENNFNGKKANASSRARSSPLRRLLDPLMKPKGAQSADNMNSTILEPVNTSELVQGKKHKSSSSVKAILQLSMKYGVPFFKLVVDNSSDILAAAVKNLPTSGKDDPRLIYVFYSVHEFKKKNGGWINQGSKGKSCGFGYNIVGQMKISSSLYSSDYSGQNRKDPFVVRESVLYSVDQITHDIMPNWELSAIIVKNPSDGNGDGETEISKSTVVILPGGIHGLPNSGVPSPLIKRWRSGGICDCGGWDVGCKLQILTNRDEMGQIPRPSIPCSSASRLDLCHQDGHQDKNIFSLSTLQNGFYSLEYNSSISLLQAFSICVAVVSSQKLARIFEVNNLSEEKQFSEPVTGNDSLKTSTTTVRAEVPAKYVSSPPLSPVGRV